MTKRAKSSFVTASNPPRVVRSGALFQDSDPVIQGREGLFEDVDDYIERLKGPEQATAAPGEKRSITTVRKRTVKKDDTVKKTDSEGADK